MEPNSGKSRMLPWILGGALIGGLIWLIRRFVTRGSVKIGGTIIVTPVDITETEFNVPWQDESGGDPDFPEDHPLAGRTPIGGDPQNRLRVTVRFRGNRTPQTPADLPDAPLHFLDHSSGLPDPDNVSNKSGAPIDSVRIDRLLADGTWFPGAVGVTYRGVAGVVFHIGRRNAKARFLIRSVSFGTGDARLTVTMGNVEVHSPTFRVENNIIRPM